MYTQNNNFFESIDSEEKAYWLGFLATDGCVTDRDTIIIGLASRDVGHLNKFLNSIGSDSRVYAMGVKAVQICVRSKKMCSDLLHHGITPRKTFTVKPTVLRDDLIKHYWRGCVDGDGSLFLNRTANRYILSYVGNFEMAEGFRTVMNSVTGSTSKLMQADSIWKARVSGSYKSFMMAEYLYKNSSIYLDRKYHSYLALCNRIEEEKNLIESSFRPEDVAKSMGVTVTRVHQLIRWNKLEVSKIGNKYFVSQAVRDGMLADRGISLN